MAGEGEAQLIEVRVPAGWTFVGLLAGLGLGLAIAGNPAAEPMLAVAGPVGQLWLRALQMPIIPLVAALLVMGISQIIIAARAGAVARRTISWILGVLLAGAIASAIVMPLMLEAFPIPAGSANLLLTEQGETPTLPAIGDFAASLVAPNVVAAAAETAMLPLAIFFTLLAVAITGLPEAQRDLLLAVFRALGNAMLRIIGWVLWVAPVGVFALALGVAASGGGGAFATFIHYIVMVSAIGGLLLIAGYVIAVAAGRRSPLNFARSMLPAQTVALSTQSSLASLPAMLDSARRLELRQSTADFVLPLAVAIFRATGPAMNLAVVIYVAHLAGVGLTPQVFAAGIAVAMLTSIGSVSLPSAVSFVVAIGPVALAMGVPVEPLALLIAVEMLPDIMRTVANVTCDVGVTAAVDRADDESALGAQP